MDDLDHTLLTLLKENARMSTADLARRAGVARTTVQARIERMENNGVIAGYTVRPGPALHKGQIRATVLVQLEPRATPAVLDRLKHMAEVDCAHTASGRFDLVLQLSASTTDALDRALDIIGEIRGVKGSESLIHLSTRIDRTS